MADQPLAAPPAGGTAVSPLPAGPAGASGWEPPAPAAGVAISPRVEQPTAGSTANSADLPRAAASTASKEIERGELDPVLAADGSGLPVELWRGLDAAKVEAHVAKLALPPRSEALHRLWRRLLLAEVNPNGSPRPQFDAFRLDLMYRSGLLADAATLLEATATTSDPMLLAMRARTGIAVGDTATGCAAQNELLKRASEVPKALRGSAMLLAGYCAGIAGNPTAAGVAAELAREEGAASDVALAALDAMAAARTTRLPVPKSLTLLDYRFLVAAGGVDIKAAIERGDAGVLYEIARDGKLDPSLRIAAAEAAARNNALDGAGLAEIYRSVSIAGLDAGDPLAQKVDPALRRAILFRIAESERTALRRTRVIRALLDDGRRVGLYLPLLNAVSKAIGEIQIVQEIGWFAETAIEAMLASGDYEQARRIAAAAAGINGGEATAHWLALADIADPGLQRSVRGQSLASVEQLALRGRYGPELLHRLATVLDALDYNVPIPLWEAASRTPQPKGGHLPETGVLSALKDAAVRREFGHTVLLAMRTLGPSGSEGAHVIALGDAIRALKRAGLEADARRLGFEALFAGWPRTANN